MNINVIYSSDSLELIRNDSAELIIICNMHVLISIIFCHFHSQSERAALISASDLPAVFALAIIVVIKSSGERSRSAPVDSTPSLDARLLTYPLFLILPMFDKVECTSASALKFGMLSASFYMFATLFSEAAIPSSIAF